MKHLQFKVNSQTLKRLDSFKPAAGSVNYLTAAFSFSDDWSGTTKTAKCRKDNAIYSAAINSSGVCLIPHEVLTQDEAKRAFGVQEFYISVEGVNGSKTITTAEIKIELSLTGAGEEANAGDPTPELYAQYIADVKAETKANADTAAAAAESATASAASMMNNYANALKGNASGAVVRVDDVSPVEHFPVVKVHGKNLIKYPYRNTTQTIGGVTFTDKGDGGITMEGTSTGGCNFFFTNYDFNIRKGKTYTFSLSGDFNATSDIDFWIYSTTLGEGMWLNTKSAKSKTFTAEKDFTDAAIYCVVGKETTVSGSVYIMLEYGEAATEYTPYIDPTTITLTRCGKNLLQPRSNNGAGYTVKPNDDGSVTVTGAANTTNSIYLTIATVSENNPLRLTAGQAYKMQGWSNNEKHINIKVMNDDGEAAWTSPSNIVSCFANGYLNIVQIYVESIGHAEGDTSLCGTYKFMLEVGETATAFEAYTAESYTPETDGTIDGLTTISPTMTLLSDHEGVTIDCEYNRDINKAFAMLEALLSNQ